MLTKDNIIFQKGQKVVLKYKKKKNYSYFKAEIDCMDLKICNRDRISKPEMERLRMEWLITT